MNSMLQRLSPRFSVRDAAHAASSSGIVALEGLFEAAGFPMPDDYRSLLREATDIELAVDGDHFLRVWGPEQALDRNAGHLIQRYFRGVAFADDEGTRVYVLTDGASGPGVYRTWFGDLDPTEALFIARGVEALLVGGEGADLLFLD
jgi:hypothetical protein